jgi:hypothetical protein
LFSHILIRILGVKTFTSGLLTQDNPLQIRAGIASGPLQVIGSFAFHGSFRAAIGKQLCENLSDDCPPRVGVIEAFDAPARPGCIGMVSGETRFIDAKGKEPVGEFHLFEPASFDFCKLKRFNC